MHEGRKDCREGKPQGVGRNEQGICQAKICGEDLLGFGLVPAVLAAAHFG